MKPTHPLRPAPRFRSGAGHTTLLPLFAAIGALGVINVSGDDADIFELATEIDPGTWEASLTQGDVDWFRFTTASHGLVAIYSQGFTDTSFRLFDVAGNDLSIADQNSGHGYNFSDVRALPAGTYHIRVTGATGGSPTGDYSLTLRTQESAPVIEDLLIPGNLSPGQIDFLTIPVNRAGLFEVYTAGGVDTTGRLYDASGNQVEYDANHGAGDNFHIKREALPAGTYLLRIEAGSSGAVEGPYMGFVLRPERAEVIRDGSYRRALAFPGNVNHYAFTMPARGTVRVWSTGTTDTSAELYDAAGIYLTGIGDGNDGAGDNFLIEETLEPGRYYLRVFAGSGASQPGAYQLFLDLPGGSDAALALKRKLQHQLAMAKNQLKRATSPALIRKLKREIASLNRRIRAL